MNKIELAVLPLKQSAIDRSLELMKSKIDSIYAELEASNWDANLVAPYPKNWQSDYKAAKAKYDFVRMVTTWVTPTHRHNEPDLHKPSQEKIDRVLQITAENAAAMYEAYVSKLNKKIGEVDSAILVGANNIWSYSVLEITKGDTIERWKTQCIVNVSVLGKLFNQWPTRLMKS